MSNFVDTVLAIFRLPVAQRIGSASIDTVGDINVGPLIAVNPKNSSSRVFDTISEYFDFLFTLKRETVNSMNPEDQQRAKDNLSFVEAKVLSLLQNITDPSLLRCVLRHADLHNHNILVMNDGSITAVLDWEVNCIVPAILGVDYPRWLEDKGNQDPQFAPDNIFWEDSPSERKRICAQFEEVRWTLLV
jgi:hypothetical protein